MAERLPRRPRRHRRHRVWAGAVWTLATAGAGAQLPPAAAPADTACGAQLPAAGRQVLRGPQGLQLAFSPMPHPVPLGQHFQLRVQVCPGPGQAWPRALQVAADMPAHRHGMNYQPTVQTTAPGHYRVQGLLWHMPGHWRWTFSLDLGDASAPLRLVHDDRL